MRLIIASLLRRAADRISPLRLEIKVVHVPVDDKQIAAALQRHTRVHGWRGLA